MVARRGGQSTATGVSYHAWAFARALLDVYVGTTDRARAELPPHIDLGGEQLGEAPVDDFLVVRGQMTQFYEAKVNAPGGGQWTVDRLHREEVLPDFIRQLRASERRRCWLVTASPCELLGAVAEGARQYTFAEFAANLSQTQRGVFREACEAEGISAEELHSLLARCHLDQIGAPSLEQSVRRDVQTPFADPDKAFAVLRGVALDSLRGGGDFTKSQIHEALEQKGVYPATRLPEDDLLQAVRSASSSLRACVRRIGDVHIDRPEVGEIIEHLTAGEDGQTKVAVLLDEAKYGKTVVAADVLDRLENQEGYAVLALKADALPNFVTLQDLAVAAGLPAQIESVIQTLHSSNHGVTVIIDQLDALSAVMARDDSALRTMLDLVARLGRIEGLPMLIACRTFDWEHDERLRSLHEGASKTFKLGRFSEEQVNEVLAPHGLTTANLHSTTRELVKTPYHLRVLVDLTLKRRQEDPTWTPSNVAHSLQSLHQEWWEQTLRLASRQSIDQRHCQAIVDAMADHMQETQELVAPASLVEDKSDALHWLAHEGFVLRDGPRVRFAHQTLFDHFAARRFVAKGTSVVDFLKGTEQGLFHRPLVRQVLEYMRGTNRQVYLAELERLLNEGGIRKHIRSLTVACLGAQHEPWGGELELLEPMLSDEEHRWRALRHLSAGWFDLLGAERFRIWLETLPEAQIGIVLWYLGRAIDSHQQAVTDLLRPYLGRSAEWNSRIGQCLHGIGREWDDCSVDLLTALLQDDLTLLDEDHVRWIWAFISLAEKHPSKACTVFGTLLDEHWRRWDVQGRPGNAIDTENGQRIYLDGLPTPSVSLVRDSIATLAEREPALFLQTVLPRLTRLMDLCHREANVRGFRSSWGGFHLEEPREWDASDHLLGSVAKAARRLAADRPPEFQHIVPSLLAGEFEGLQTVVAQAYAANPETYYRNAADFLVSDSRRFYMGWLVSGWPAVQLVRACESHWPAAEFSEVETAILNLRPPWEWRIQELDGRREHRLHVRGHLQLSLLKALDRTRLSPQGKNLLGQMERKFPDFVQPQPRPLRMQPQAPPIPAEAVERMDDAGWLEAMKDEVVASETGGPAHLNWPCVHLSRALRKRAKEEPERFYGLCRDRMDETYQSAFVAAIIEGLADAKMDIDWIANLVSQYREILEAEEIRPVCSAILDYAGSRVPESLIDTVREWATQAPNPRTADDTPFVRSGGDSDDSRLGLVTEGINTDRGQAVWTLGQILLKAAPPRHGEYLDVVETLADDPVPAVRAVALEFLQYTIPAETVRACKVLMNLVGDCDLLVAQPAAENAVYRAHFRHPDEVLWAIGAMVSHSDSERAQEAGGRQACLAAFKCPKARRLRDLCLFGLGWARQAACRVLACFAGAGIPFAGALGNRLLNSKAAHRRGAADVYAANANDDEVGRECRRRLRFLWEDPDQKVRERASIFLRKLDRDGLRALDRFTRNWAASKAFPAGVEKAARKLNEHPTVNPSLTVEIAMRTLELVGPDMADITQHTAMLSHYLTPAVVSVYHFARDPDLRARAMDVFERMEELGCYEIQKVLEEADRI